MTVAELDAVIGQDLHLAQPEPTAESAKRDETYFQRGDSFVKVTSTDPVWLQQQILKADGDYKRALLAQLEMVLRTGFPLSAALLATAKADSYKAGVKYGREHPND
jgi:hypothetical protein